MGEVIGSAAGATGEDAGAVYALGSSQGESARLQRQAEELAADSAVLLDRVGLLAGQSAIDLGCGPRGVLDLLAERVAPAGRVVGLDSDPAHAAMAAEFAAGRGLGGVEVITADARSIGLPPGSFDLVHARTLLVNLPAPAEVAAEMTRLARPGGWVACMEPDTEHALCDPPHPAFDPRPLRGRRRPGQRRKARGRTLCCHPACPAGFRALPVRKAGYAGVRLRSVPVSRAAAGPGWRCPGGRGCRWGSAGPGRGC